MNKASDPTTPAAPTFKNRRGGLVAFGIVQLLIAAALFLMIISLTWVISSGAIPRSQPQGQLQVSPRALLLLSGIMYGGVGLVFAALGIGSILAKNWARIGTLVVSWIWLVIGMFSVVSLAVLMPTIFTTVKAPAGNLSPDLISKTVRIMLIFMSAIFVLLPSIFLIFYHSKNVAATCLQDTATIDLRPRTPILMLVLMMWFGLSLLSAALIPFALSKYPVMVFGVLVWGWGSRLIYLGYGAVEAFALWGYARRDLRAWWVALAGSTF